MSRFEYLSVLLSVVVGFAISEILSGWGSLIRRRAQLRPYWLLTSWSVLALVVMILFWWSAWDYHTTSSWTFFSFLAVLSAALTFVILAFVLTPTVSEDSTPDLRDYYFRNRTWIFGLWALVLVQVAAVDVIVARLPLWHVANAIRALGFAVAVALMRSQAERVHAALMLASCGLVAAFGAWRFYGP
jgi:hypothetical protein